MQRAHRATYLSGFTLRQINRAGKGRQDTSSMAFTTPRDQLFHLCFQAEFSHCCAQMSPVNARSGELSGRSNSWASGLCLSTICETTHSFIPLNCNRALSYPSC